MRAVAEFRISEKKAAQHLPRGVGVAIGHGVVKLEVPVDDTLFLEIGRIDRALQSKGSCLFTSWEIKRRYSSREIGAATRFLLWPRRTFEPCGEECGTEYDDSKSCPECGSGAPQTTSLRLDVGRIPRGVAIASTIADEVVVSDAFVRAVRKGGLTGCEARRIEAPSLPRKSTVWFQMTIAGDPVALHPETRTGDDPFDVEGSGRCKRGDLLGLNLLSEVSLVGATDSGADFVRTREWVGARRGLLRPHNLILVSQKARGVLLAHKLKGICFEVAHVR